MYVNNFKILYNNSDYDRNIPLFIRRNQRRYSKFRIKTKQKTDSISNKIHPCHVINA